ncbi:MAG: hypothetical protein QNJ05_10325 [Woeseiaceae bacterium]|nr:hypothetical protein [Woeseiaceae bacterium]
MTGRVALLSSGKTDPQDSEKLLNLYRSRVELKKAFSEAKAEKHALNKLVHERDGSVARLEQKLSQIEELLLDPEWVYSVAVHYQLRALNDRCRARVASFAEQLKRRQETRKHQAILDSWNARRSGQASKVEKELTMAAQAIEVSEQRIADAEASYREHPFFVRIFKRRAFRKEVRRLEHAQSLLHEKETELKSVLDELGNSAAPEQQGLDQAAKRSINFMILSFAQQLYIQFGDDNIASLVKEAGDKSAGAIRYGNREDCQRLLEEVASRWDAFDNVTDHADALQKRAKLLSERAIFMNDDDVIPPAGSAGTLICINDGGSVTEKNADLLGEDYWGLTKVFSR